LLQQLVSVPADEVDALALGLWRSRGQSELGARDRQNIVTTVRRVDAPSAAKTKLLQFWLRHGLDEADFAAIRSILKAPGVRSHELLEWYVTSGGDPTLEAVIDVAMSQPPQLLGEATIDAIPGLRMEVDAWRKDSTTSMRLERLHQAWMTNMFDELRIKGHSSGEAPRNVNNVGSDRGEPISKQPFVGVGQERQSDDDPASGAPTPTPDKDD